MQHPSTSNKNAIHALPRLNQSEEKTHDVANQIQQALGSKDEHSKHFHLLIASRIPEKIILAHLADIRADGARNPGALFTYRMTKYAKERLAEREASLRDFIDKLTPAKRVL
jgi:hypothetical protein